jgi:myo-inositol 2-dehydrogenase / D-chiro-inositol 1-dehydrogenase
MLCSVATRARKGAPVHLGILGVGRIGRMHARHALGCERVTAVTLHDVDGSRVDELSGELDLPGTTDLDRLLSTVDAVLVATPTPVHGDAVRAALAAGVHVLCEKPLALDPTLITELAALTPGGVHLVVGFQRRFDPAYAAIRAAIAAGEYGTVFLVRATAFDHAPPDLGYIATSGGIFHDQFIHDLDALPWVLGERAVAVQATGSVLVDPGFADAGDVDTASVTLRFASGALGVITGGRCDGGGYDNRLEVFAQRAAVCAGLDERTPLTSLEPGVPPPREPHQGFDTRWARGYRRELEVFTDVVAGAAVNPSPALDGLHSLEIARACELSRRADRTVRIAADGTLS